MTPFASAYLHAANLIAGADALVIAAGAGMGVDSGLPDFRGNDGFWRAYPALAKAQVNFMEVASGSNFVTDPTLAWGFYGHRLALYRKTTPHPGFEILRKWAARMPQGARVFTSNVDGQFQKAGFPEAMVHECHGSIHHLQCLEECESEVWAAQGFTPEVDDEACRLRNAPPRCPSCGEMARPNVLMFNDWHWRCERSEAQQKTETRWLNAMSQHRPRMVVVEMGAGTAIPSVRNFSHRVSHDHGARIIRINPREPRVPSTLDVGIATGSLEALRGIDLMVDAILDQV